MKVSFQIHAFALSTWKIHGDEMIKKKIHVKDLKLLYSLLYNTYFLCFLVDFSGIEIKFFSALIFKFHG